jgi:hypothetical protein
LLLWHFLDTFCPTATMTTPTDTGMPDKGKNVERGTLGKSVPTVAAEASSAPQAGQQQPVAKDAAKEDKAKPDVTPAT